jgi:hypothetical protein
VFNDQTFVVTATCQQGHSQTIRLQGYSREAAEMWAGLLDGTAAVYVYPPGPESVIGKCGICQTPFTCTVTEEQPAPVAIEDPPPPQQ